MFRAFAYLLVIAPIVWLAGCGDGVEEETTSASIQLPLALPAILTQDGFVARITVTGPGMDEISRERDIGVRPARGGVREITVDNIPVGPNRTVTAEILRGEEVYFEGSQVVNLSSGGANNVVISLRQRIVDDGPGGDALQEEIRGTWFLTNTVLVGLVVFYEDDGTYAVSGDGGVTWAFGQYVLDGDELTLFIFDDSASGIVEVDGDIMTISTPDGIVEVYERILE